MHSSFIVFEKIKTSSPKRKLPLLNPLPYLPIESNKLDSGFSYKYKHMLKNQVTEKTEYDTVNPRLIILTNRSRSKPFPSSFNKIES